MVMRGVVQLLLSLNDGAAAVSQVELLLVVEQYYYVRFPPPPNLATKAGPEDMT